MSGNKNTGPEKDSCGQCDPRSNKSNCPKIRNVTHPLRYYEFTQDELKALEECDKESFYRRCLPFSTLFASITYAAIKYGYVKRDPNFGVVPKVILAAIIGHVYGRLSYMSHCDKKIRKLPANSKLGNIMRQYYEKANPPPDPKRI